MCAFKYLVEHRNAGLILLNRNLSSTSSIQHGNAIHHSQNHSLYKYKQISFASRIIAFHQNSIPSSKSMMSKRYFICLELSSLIIKGLIWLMLRNPGISPSCGMNTPCLRLPQCHIRWLVSMLSSVTQPSSHSMGRGHWIRLN